MSRPSLSPRGEGGEWAGPDLLSFGEELRQREESDDGGGDSIWRRSLSPVEDRGTEEKPAWTVGSGTGWTAG